MISYFNNNIGDTSLQDSYKEGIMMDDKEMAERRLFERITAPLKIRYEIVENPPAAKMAASKDISGGGIRLSLSENLKIGTNLKLDIEIPDGANKTTTAYGTVVWAHKVEITGARPDTYYDTGIQFTYADPITIGKIFKQFSKEG